MPIRRKLRPSTEFSMASMSDLVFLLLCFFMVTSNFVKVKVVPIQLPSSDQEVSTDANTGISITEDGKYYWNGAEVEPGKELVDKESWLKAEIDKYYADTVLSKKSITLSMDKAVDVGAMTPILGWIKGYGGAVAIQVQK